MTTSRHKRLRPLLPNDSKESSDSLLHNLPAECLMTAPISTAENFRIAMMSEFIRKRGLYAALMQEPLDPATVCGKIKELTEEKIYRNPAFAENPASIAPPCPLSAMTELASAPRAHVPSTSRMLVKLEKSDQVSPGSTPGPSRKVPEGVSSFQLDPPRPKPDPTEPTAPVTSLENFQKALMKSFIRGQQAKKKPTAFVKPSPVASPVPPCPKVSPVEVPHAAKVMDALRSLFVTEIERNKRLEQWDSGFHSEESGTSNVSGTASNIGMADGTSQVVLLPKTRLNKPKNSAEKRRTVQSR